MRSTPSGPSGSGAASTLQKQIHAFEVARQELTQAIQRVDQTYQTLVRALGKSTHANADELPHHKQSEAFFVDRLWNGRLIRTEILTLDEIEKILRLSNFNVVIDELKHSVTVRFGKHHYAYPLAKIPGMQRGMLWLVLTKAGHYISHEDIERLFQLPRGGQIHPFRTILGNLLGGNLLKLVLPGSLDKRYPVPREGWSFCWIRLSEDPKQSELLYRVPRTKK